MLKRKAIAGLALAIAMLFSSAAYAVETEVTGQVTINNVDEADNTIKLNGAEVEITNKETNERFNDIIEYNGTLVYELPLGNYSLVQTSPPEGYVANSKVFEFKLQLPAGATAESVRVVNATVMVTNHALASEGGNSSLDNSSQSELSPDAQPPSVDHSSDESLVAKNPVTSDNSFFFALSLVVLTIGLCSAIYTMNKLVKR
ncbi:MAG: prealbumin-like fold domain-containing protein [Clostridiales bacterium]|jgi:uncharacterized surface anchored protein|nr:prealbumin-like fold domain-containing protein [Clostridiales bacterium]